MENIVTKKLPDGWDEDDLAIGVNCIVLDKEGRILLGKRKNCFGEGTYGLIGGKLKQGETFEEGAKRELKEETNLDAEVEELEVINLANVREGKHIPQIGILVKKYKGTLENREPNRCEELRFFAVDNLPDLFCATEPNIQLYLENKFYDRTKNK